MNPVADFPGSNTRQVGRPLPRLEDERHLSGQATFVADLALPGTRDVAFVRSQVAHGRLLSVDIPPHVDPVSVWTGQRISPFVKPLRTIMDRASFRQANQPILAQDRVRFVGELVAAVVADNRALAEDAAEAVEVSVDPWEVVLDPVAALAPDALKLHEEWPDNAYMSTTAVLGDFEAAVASAEIRIEREFRMARVAPVPMETRGCVAHFERASGILTVYLSTQRPHFARTLLAEQLVGIAETDIRVIALDVGGGFGSKGNLYPEEIAVAAIALQSHHPVRWIEDRWENLVGGSQARDYVQHIIGYANRRGDLLAVDARFVVSAGAYAMRSSGPLIEANMAASVLPGPYRLRNYRYEAITVATNKAPIGPYRGVGRPAGVFAIERILDEIAHECGLEPHEVRRRNMIAVEEHPYETITGQRYDSGDYHSLLQKAVESIGIVQVRAEQRERSRDNRFAVGVGLGCYTEQTGHGAEEWRRRGSQFVYGFEAARARIEPSGGVSVAVGIQSHGQGLETTLAQIAANALGLDYADVRIVHGDSALCPYGLGTVASRSIVMAGGAVHGACERLATKLRIIAGHLLGVPPDEVALVGGVAAAAGKELSIAELAFIAYLGIDRLPRDMEPGLEQTFHYRPSVETGAYSSGVSAAKVQVDLDTGHIKLLDFVVAEDCGRIVNPLVADGQVIGGTAQGIGQALFEEILHDETGQPIRVTLADYLLPGAGEVPHVRVMHQETLSPFTVFGVKGLGEGGAIGPPAAIANAVTDALRAAGIRHDVRSMPITPRSLWPALSTAAKVEIAT